MDCGDGAACVWQRLLKSPLVKKGVAASTPNFLYSICFPKNAAADCASFTSAFDGSRRFSPLSRTTAPITSPDAMIGNTTAALCSMPSIGCTLLSVCSLAV